MTITERAATAPVEAAGASRAWWQAVRRHSWFGLVLTAGLVLRVLAEPGTVVTAGQPLLVLEAMKMEQTVSAPADGVVAELRAKAGEQVSTGQVLAVLEAPPAKAEG